MRRFVVLVVLVVVVLVVIPVALLFIGSLGQTNPRNPWIAGAIGLFLLVLGVSAFRSLARSRGPEQREEAEDVGELDVFFVCGECGTEFRVEKLGELQVPRHCGEPMLVERRAASGPR